MVRYNIRRIKDIKPIIILIMCVCIAVGIGFTIVSLDEDIFSKGSTTSTTGGLKYKFGSNTMTLKLNYDIDIEPQGTKNIRLEYYLPRNTHRQVIISESKASNYGEADYKVANTKAGNKVAVWNIDNYNKEINISHQVIIKTKEVNEVIPVQEIATLQDIYKWTESSDFINSNHPVFNPTVGNLSENSKWQTVKRIFKYTDKEYDYRRPEFEGEKKKASEILKKMDEGDCEEQAGLTSAIGRASDIPSRVIIGTYGMGEYFIFHAWSEHYTQYGWVQYDVSNESNNFGRIGAKYIRIYSRPDVFTNKYFSDELPYKSMLKSKNSGPLVYYGWQGEKPIVNQQVEVEKTN